MDLDLINIVKKGRQFGEQAIRENKTNNYEIATQAHMAMSDCFKHAIKYGIVDEEMKKDLHSKIEEIGNIMKDDMLKGHSSYVSGHSRDDNKNNTDIPNNKSNTSFDDIIGLTNAKTALFEAIILPAKFPKLFQDKDTLVTSILLYGWPGIGKTLLAKAVATECNIPFISVDAWQFATKNDDDDGGKLADRCFQLAREQQPSLLFIDNIDCLFSDDGDQTDDKSYQHIKTEFLMQMDNIQKQNGNIFILATINQPWLLTSAIQQKFHKRIYLPLPNLNERVALFKMHFDSTINYTIDEHDWIKLAEKTENYSPADITCVCREALFEPIRQVTSATHFKQVRNPKSDGTAQLWFICSSVDPAAEMLTFDQIEPNELYLPPVTMFDMLTALDTVKHSISDADIAKYEKFAKENP